MAYGVSVFKGILSLKIWSHRKGISQLPNFRRLTPKIKGRSVEDPADPVETVQCRRYVQVRLP
jgi:hypothetical protein